MTTDQGKAMPGSGRSNDLSRSAPGLAHEAGVTPATPATGGRRESEWCGRTGDVWSEEWRRTDRSFAGLDASLRTAILAAAGAATRAVDLGCGAGHTSIALATARPDIAVTGLDISAALIGIATERGAGIDTLDFQVQDTAALDPDTGADLFVSRHGVMFFADPVAAFATIRAGGRDGGRLVFSCFRVPSANPWAEATAGIFGAPARTPAPGYAPGPFGMADRDRNRSELQPELRHRALAGEAAYGRGFGFRRQRGVSADPQRRARHPGVAGIRIGLRFQAIAFMLAAGADDDVAVVADRAVGRRGQPHGRRRSRRWRPRHPRNLHQHCQHRRHIA